MGLWDRLKAELIDVVVAWALYRVFKPAGERPLDARCVAQDRLRGDLRDLCRRGYALAHGEPGSLIERIFKEASCIA